MTDLGFIVCGVAELFVEKLVWQDINVYFCRPKVSVYVYSLKKRKTTSSKLCQRN